VTTTDTSAEARALIDTTRTIVRLADGKQTHVRVTTGVLTDMADTLAALMAERDEAIQRGNDWCDQARTLRGERDRLRAEVAAQVEAARREGLEEAAGIVERVAIKGTDHLAAAIRARGDA
jgi:enamine deaminase RidA (YjgF/YER057c/UK114 family)